jgi:hypothetical protein
MSGKIRLAQDVGLNYHLAPPGVSNPVMIFEFRFPDGSTDSIAVLCRNASEKAMLPVLKQLDEVLSSVFAIRAQN